MIISVALCTYNGSQFLTEQLASIAQQTRLPDELVICDDVSRDTTIQIIESFASEVSFTVRLYQNQFNLGSTKNFEQAIRLCTGEIIVLADQDDYWYPHKLAHLEAVFIDKPETGLVFSDAHVVNAERHGLGYTLWQSVRFDHRQQRQITERRAVEVLLRHPVVTGATMAFHSRFRDFILPISADWVHDEWISLIIAIRAPVVILADPLMQYRRHDANQVGTENVKPIERLRTALQTDPNIYLKRYKQYQILHDHLHQNNSTKAATLSAFKQKQAHFFKRGTLPRQRMRRILPIVGEFLSGGYHRYSGSWLNAIRDLLLKHR